MCHPDKPFTSDKLQCVFNEYKAAVWVPPRPRPLSRAPLPEAGGENLHLKISRVRKRNLPFVVRGEEEASTLALTLSPITSAIQTGLTEKRLISGLVNIISVPVRKGERKLAERLVENDICQKKHLESTEFSNRYVFVEKKGEWALLTFTLCDDTSVLTVLSSLHPLPILFIDAHREFLHRPASGYVPEEIWKKAEEAVNEVKRQAMTELQKAVSEAERKAHDMITTERAKMERTVAEAKRQAAEDALAVINQQEDSSESCWNCGRKASETCSGCNTARYCGSFCQHKDWEKHHHICGQTLQAQQQGDTPAVSSSVTPNSGAGSPMDTPPAATPRSTTPGTPSTIETTPR
ncbi:protein CBFA2T1 [Sapajus apella]|uniref:Protein CBFA2T1 n=1 Tax=Sapajus apella TaxID=9515 RepID=A0A6J3FDI7_SAPAP|nr:protein CBFA2T1 [Sapajus apella]